MLLNWQNPRKKMEDLTELGAILLMYNAFNDGLNKFISLDLNRSDWLINLLT